MSNTNAKRATTIPIRVTLQEKEHISKNAEAYGGPISKYARDLLLHPDGDYTNGAKMQAIVRELCCLNEIIKNSNDSQLRSNLEEWSENIWQFIK